MSTKLTSETWGKCHLTMGNVRGQPTFKKQQRLSVGVSIYRRTVIPDLLTSSLKMTEIPPLNVVNNK